MSTLFYIVLGLFLLYILRKFLNGPKTKLTKDMTGKVILITGASAGIGKETAKDLLQKGATVIFAGRDETKCKNVIKNITEKFGIKSELAIFLPLDLSSLKSVINFSELIHKRFSKIDILINNAGCCEEKFRKTEDDIETTFQTNHISHTVLTGLMIDLLKKSDDPRILNLGSEAHKFAKLTKEFFKFEQNTYQIFNTYAVTKLANIFLTYDMKSYSEKNNLNIKSVCIHPGAVYTEISRPENKSLFYKLFIYLICTPLFLFAFKTEEMGAQTTIHCCYLDKENFVDGGYYKNCKLSKVSKTASDKNSEKEINDYTYEAIKSKLYEKLEGENEFINFMEFMKVKIDNE